MRQSKWEPRSKLLTDRLFKKFSIISRHTLLIYNACIFTQDLVPTVGSNTHNDLYGGFEVLEGQGSPCDQPAPSHRNDYSVHIRHLFYDLQSHGSLSGQDVGVVVTIATRRYNTRWIITHLTKVVFIILGMNTICMKLVVTMAKCRNKTRLFLTHYKLKGIPC